MSKDVEFQVKKLKAAEFFTLQIDKSRDLIRKPQVVTFV